MTPPPDPVAALAEALHRVWSRSGSEGATIEDEAEYLHERLTDAGWSLSHDSERRSEVIGSERSDNEALVAAVKRLPLFDEPDLITAMNGTVRSPRTIADYVEGYRNRVLAVIEGGR